MATSEKIAKPEQKVDISSDLSTYSRPQDKESYSLAKCSSIVLIIIGMCSSNPLALMMGVFALVAICGIYESWKTWSKVVNCFYKIHFIICILLVPGGIITFIVGLCIFNWVVFGIGIGLHKI